jgi:excisionase family DNA binding protein
MKENHTNKIESPLLTRPQAAAYLNISQRTLDEQAARGNIRTVKIGRSVRFRKKTLDEFIEIKEDRPRRKNRG